MNYEVRIAEGDSAANTLGLTDVTVSRLLKEEDGADLISLYVFLCYTARWQKTSRPKCSVSYISSGLRWGERKVQVMKSQLARLGLIEDVRSVDESGKVVGWFVKVRHMVSVVSTPSEIEVVDSENHPLTFTTGGESKDKCLYTGKNKKKKTGKGNEDGEAEAKIPSNLNTPEFQEAWQRYLDFRKASKFKKLLPMSIQSQWEKMSKWGHDAAIESIENSIANGWQGLFPPKTMKNPESQSPLPFGPL